MTDTHQFVRVELSRFKAFKSFSIDLRHFNILVGPNNAGKSTILAAFRILAAAMRRAESRSAKRVRGPDGVVLGYHISLASISVAEENIFYNYDDGEPATVTFRLSNRNTLTLYFPEHGACVLVPDAQGKIIATPKSFKTHFNCPIGFVPILGPVEHHEILFEKEAARLALFNYRAARNFRNIWHHYPEKFSDFRSALQQTWPGMDIQRPEVDRSHDRPRLHMYCPENRIPREIFWSGFGFQVWCQMLTHLIQSSEVSLFLIDEPDIYLHSELQRQLLGLLRGLGPDILIATHSTEIITEAETDDIVLVNKGRNAARRIKNPSELEQIFVLLGSSINPILTQLAKTRRVLFVEGQDFQILGKFARRIGELAVGNRSDFAIVPVEGFNPERIRVLKLGMETTLGVSVASAAILDRDYRSMEECEYIERECAEFCGYVRIHQRKEIENFLLVPTAIDRAAQQKVSDRVKRSNIILEYEPCSRDVLLSFSEEKRSYVTAQLLAEARRFGRARSSRSSEASLDERALRALDLQWADEEARIGLIPGKEALSAINKVLQDKYGVSVTPTSIIDAMRLDEVPIEMRALVQSLKDFSSAQPGT